MTSIKTLSKVVTRLILAKVRSSLHILFVLDRLQYPLSLCLHICPAVLIILTILNSHHTDPFSSRVYGNFNTGWHQLFYMCRLYSSYFICAKTKMRLRVVIHILLYLESCLLAFASMKLLIEGPDDALQVMSWSL